MLISSVVFRAPLFERNLPTAEKQGEVSVLSAIYHFVLVAAALVYLQREVADMAVG